MPSLRLHARVLALISRQQPALLLGVLTVLCTVLWLGPHGALARGLFLAEIGLMLLWQPYLRGARALTFWELLALLGLVGLVLWALDWWLLALWIMLCAGITGGKVFFHEGRVARLYYLLAFGVLVLMLSAVALPAAFAAHHLAAAPLPLVLHGLIPLLLLAMLLLLLIHRETPPVSAELVDFLYSALVFLILAVLALGALAVMSLWAFPYGVAILVSLLGLGLLLLLLGWAWRPQLRLATLIHLFSRHLLSVGLPFEQWLHALAELARVHNAAQPFLNAACHALCGHLPWIRGGVWRDAESGHSESFGEPQGEEHTFTHGALSITLACHYRASPTLTWHLHLLTQLLAEFFQSKQRAEQLRQLSYVEAVHHTGARLTHDLRNLLQSIDNLCAAAQAEGEQPSPQLIQLWRHQLPVIQQRLAATLHKLRAPHSTATEPLQAAAEWFEQAVQRYRAQGVDCSAPALPAALCLPPGLFQCALENLLHNALRKRHADGRPVRVRCQLDVLHGQPRLRVCDDGAALPAAVLPGLLRQPVASSDGLGIGLYQTALLARQHAFALRLAENSAGAVCFELAAVPGAEAAQQR